MRIERARAHDLAAIRALLDAAALPSADIDATCLQTFFVARADRDDPVIAAVGLEAHPPVALLRSLVVAPTQRGAGLGATLLDAAQTQACEMGIGELVLLTTTAERFFLRYGYATIARADAPAALQSTREFASLCPASAVCMRKSIKKR